MELPRASSPPSINLGATSMRFSSPTGRFDRPIRNDRAQRRPQGQAAVTVFTTAIGSANSKKKWMRMLAARAVAQAHEQGSDGSGSDGSEHSDSDDGSDSDGEWSKAERQERRVQRRVERLVAGLTPLQQMAAERMMLGTPLEPALAKRKQFRLPRRLLKLLQPDKPGAHRPRPPPSTEEQIAAAAASTDHEISANGRRH